MVVLRQLEHNVKKKNVYMYRNDPKFSDIYVWANSADLRAVWSGSTLFSIPSASFGLMTLW